MGRVKINRAVLISIVITLGFVGLTSWLFYDFEPVSLGLLVLAPFGFRMIDEEQKEKKRWALCVQFSDALLFMKNGLDAGYSAEKSLLDACGSLDGLYGKKADISIGFRKMRARIETGFSIEEAMNEFGQESGVEEIGEFAGLFAILKRTGGNLNSVIRKTCFNLKEKIELRRELSVMVAAKAGEFRIMSIMPYAIIGYLKCFAFEMVESLYHNLVGILFMTGMLAVYCFCFWFGNHMIKSRLKA